jgi:uncharacterized membrane protein YphA (DoxX/SURF4 family)
MSFRIMSIVVLFGGGITLINGLAMDVFEVVLFVCAVVAFCKGWRPWKGK